MDRVLRLAVVLMIGSLIGCVSHRDDRIDVSAAASGQGEEPKKTAASLIDEYFSLLDSSGVDDELDRTLEKLKGTPDTVPELSGLYTVLTRSLRESNVAGFAEMDYARWKTVYLLGILDDQKAVEPLTNILSAKLPDPEKVDELLFASEYRVRLRAMAGLEQLRATESIMNFYERGGILKNSAAASLYELGVKVPGVERIDGREVMGLGDPTNFRRKRSEFRDAKDAPDAGSAYLSEEPVVPIKE